MLTQEELAERAGLSVRAISDIERGRTARPYRHSLRVLADALGLTGMAREVFIREARSYFGVSGSNAVPPISGMPGGSQDPGSARDLSPWIVPRQLPAAVRQFVGRRDELRLLAALLDEHAGSRHAVVVSAVGGTAGVGKTALVVHWAHQVANQFPDGQLYVDLRGFGDSGAPMSPAEALRGFLDAFQLPPERIPASADGQAAMYRSLGAGRRMLIVLDNARDTEQVRPLLPGSPSCLVVVTSRRQLASLVATENAVPITLDVLTDVEADQLLAGRIGARRLAAEPEAVRELTQTCARLPLALALAAARAALHPKLALAALITELRQESDRLSALTASDSVASVRAVFSWSYAGLSEPAARMFRLLGLHPGPDISLPATASLAAYPEARARQLLSELTSGHLLTEHSAGRFGFHDLLRAYAAEHARDGLSDSERASAIRRMLDHYLHTAYLADRTLNPVRRPLTLTPPEPGTMPETHAGLEQAMTWFRAEHKVLLAVIGVAAEGALDACTWQLAWATATFFDRQGHWPDLITTQSVGLAAARRAADLDGMASAHRSLADADIQLGFRDQGRIHLRQALALYRQLGDLDGQARTELDLSRASDQMGDAGEALGHAGRALDLFKSTGHSSGQANALNAVGWFHAQLGNYHQALACCQQALELFRETGERYGEAATWDSLGYARHHRGEHAEALTCYKNGLALFRELGDRWQESAILTHLGDAYQLAGDLEAARHQWLQALDILGELNHPDADLIRQRLATSHGEKPG